MKSKYLVYTLEKGKFECNDKTEFMFLTLHRDPKEGPAYTSFYENGKVKSQEYWFNRKKHNEDGPATIKYYDNGNKKVEEWLINGVLTRKDGPALITYYNTGFKESEHWWRNDQRHRVDGPAVVYYNKDGSLKDSRYMLDYKEVSKEYFDRNILKEKMNIL